MSLVRRSASVDSDIACANPTLLVKVALDCVKHRQMVCENEEFLAAFTHMVDEFNASLNLCFTCEFICMHEITLLYFFFSIAWSITAPRPFNLVLYLFH